MNAILVFGLIILAALLWGICNALRESAKYKAMVSNQASLIYHSERATTASAGRHEAQIDRIAERHDIQELKERRRPHVTEPQFPEWAQQYGLEMHESGGWTAIKIKTGLGGYLMAIPFFVFHGGFALLTIGLAVYGIYISM